MPRSEVLARVPVLRPDSIARAVSDPHVLDIEVHALLDGFRRLLMRRGGAVIANSRVEGLEKVGAGWRVRSGDKTFEADVVVNAAGAWGERVGALAGAEPVGLVPKRRTAVLLGVRGHDVRAWPIVHEVDSEFYFKPDAGRILLSPADETPSEPCDAQPEEWDIAVAIARFQGAVDLPVERIEHRWAGLRSFVADKMPVVGFDPAVDGFFWLVGQGGFGIQTSPTLGRVSAALLLGESMPADVAARGVRAETIAPGRSSLRP